MWVMPTVKQGACDRQEHNVTHLRLGVLTCTSGCLQDWLFLAYQRVTAMEYGVLVATFVAIMAMGLELGIAAGIVGASLLFAYNYSKVRCSL